MATGAANSIRQLKAGQRVPAGARKVPSTYANAAGYIRERWQVGPRRYVEQYQHRRVAQPAAGQDVDHRNSTPGDNSRDNLQALSRTRHNQVAGLRRRLAATKR